ncbi:MAG TPA: ATP-dependent DNA ligase [Candidatus Altiarchaeales archaeon]|nr:ATP-dependent DNA ligase [Candidatus Altiarchaeales archaeon]
MEFNQLSRVLERIEAVSGRLEMTDIVADFISNLNSKDLPTVILFLRGRIFPQYDSRELGIAEKLMVKSLCDVSGKTEAEIHRILRKKGDMGLVAQEIIVSKTQTTLFKETLTLGKVRENLEKLATLEGKGSTDKKLGYIKELLSRATPVDAKYIVKLILGELRLGVGDGTIRDAIAKNADVPKELVENAYNLICDLSEVALIAKEKGHAGLEAVSMECGRPVRVMLAQKAESIESVIEKYGQVQAETKYDGARIQAHKNGEKVELFTRRLENVTKQFPEVVEWCGRQIIAKSCIIEGEIVAVEDRKNRRPLPFQHLSRRIKRKYRISEISRQIPVEVNIFDLIYIDGEMKTKTIFSERRKLLEDSIAPTQSFRLADKIVTADVAEVEKFYKNALDQGHEGVMLKVLDAPYKPGSRVGYMYKVKPVMETLDLVLTGATWGEGRRAKWLGSYLLSTHDSETGEFLEIGRMATGFTDAQLEEMTEKTKDLITLTDGKEVRLKPQIVVEVAYEEIQKSPTYTSGYALRFPRLVRIRDDKSIEDADSLSRVEEIMKKH